MPTIELSPGSPFCAVLVQGLVPRDPQVFKEALDRLNASGGSAQILDGSVVAGLEHIEAAARLAAASFASGRNLARSHATELLLYASGSRQIKEAIERLGVKSSSRHWVLVATGGSGSDLDKLSELFLGYGSADDRIIEALPEKTERIMGLFGISKEELGFARTLHGSGESALKALVIERVALSELYR